MKSSVNPKPIVVLVAKEPGTKVGGGLYTGRGIVES